MFASKNIVKFTSTIGPLAFPPHPASGSSPGWYKDQPLVFGDLSSSKVFGKEPGELGTRWTVKNCIPFRDMMYAGYVIPFQSDMGFRCVKDPYSEELSLESVVPEDNLGIIGKQGHSKLQFLEHPFIKNYEGIFPTNEAVKFFNPWIITTPPGYSCLFLTPQHREGKLELLSGIVDTDTYSTTVLFPGFVKLKEGEELILEAGSPLMQVIPFKRESWGHQVKDDPQMEPSLFKAFRRTNQKVGNVFSNRYKKFFWSKKDYR